MRISDNHTFETATCRWCGLTITRGAGFSRWAHRKEGETSWDLDIHRLYCESESAPEDWLGYKWHDDER